MDKLDDLQQAGAEAVAESPKSYLASITMRLAIDPCARRACGARPIPDSGEGRAVWVVSLDVVDGAIAAVRSVLNPDKLSHIRQSLPGGAI